MPLDCILCLHSLAPGSISFPCGHVFCGTCADLVKEHGVPPFTDEVFCPACRTAFPDTRHYPALRNLECTADLDRVDHLPPRLKYNPLSFVEDEDLGPPTSDSPIFADLTRIEARKKELEERKASVARRLVVLRNLKEESEEVRKRLGYCSATPRGWQWVLQPAQAVIIKMTRVFVAYTWRFWLPVVLILPFIFSKLNSA